MSACQIIDHAAPRPYRRPRRSLIRRILGVALLLSAFAPLHRWLDPERTGPAGRATRASAEAAWNVGLFGSITVVGLAFVLWRMLGDMGLRRRAAPWFEALARPRSGAFAVGVGLLALTLSTSIALWVFRGLPTSVDEMAQLAHAAALRSGSLGLPIEASPASWLIQNGWSTGSGWVSIYPPLHTALLAGGLAVGAAWLVGPLAIGLGTALTASALDAHLDDRRIARSASLLLALCPFWLLLGSTHLSHATAGAGAAAVLWTVQRATRGGWGWAVAAGAATGAFVSARPLTGLAVSAALFAAFWLPELATRGLATRGQTGRWVAGRSAAVILGGTPFAFLLLGFNQTLFGSVGTLGYSAAFGPSHGLGFHVDPWGNQYGIVEAFAYTAADLSQLGAHLFESPLPATLLIGVAALLGRLPARAAPYLAWIAAAIGANALYWHHGVHMGPRMLFETAPAWVVLMAWAASALMERSADADPAHSSPLAGISSWSVALGIVGAALLAPPFVMAQRMPESAVAQATLPVVPSDAPALVFVHGSWSSRVSARLAERGMRRDTLETALRRNDLCQVDGFARAEPGSGRALDLAPLPGSPTHLVERQLSQGNTIRVDPTLPPTPSCAREARADRLGVVELEPLLWQAGPGISADILIARDMGPVLNARVIDATGRTPWLYGDLNGSMRVLEYAEGMELLWGGATLRPQDPGD